MDYKTFIKGNMADIEKAIYQEETGSFTSRDFKNFKNNAIKELHKMANGEVFDKHLINDLINYLNNVEIKENGEYIIDNQVVDEKELSIIYHYIYMKDLRMLNDENYKNKTIEEFYKDIQNNIISISIFNTRKKLIKYLFVDRYAENGIINNIDFLLEKLETKTYYDWQKDKNVLEINDRYFIINY